MNVDTENIERLIDIIELANRTALPRSWWYAQTRRRDADAPPVLKCGKYCRFRLSEVMAWLEKQSEARHG